MSRFLCLIYHNEKERDAIPDDEWQELLRESIATGDDLLARGISLATAALQPVRTAATLHRKRGALSFTDGPFAETKEQLAGFVLIEAPDMDSAKEVARSLPPARLGSVEVRPVWERQDLATRRLPNQEARAVAR